MKTRRSIAALLLLIVSIIYNVSSAAPGNTVQTFNVRDGLPSNSISTVAQDGNGLIWIGTWNGLSFYDGYRFFTFRSGEQNGELTTNKIVDILPDRRGNVWFITYDHNLGLLNNPTGRFEDVSAFAVEPEKLSAHQAFRLYNGNDNIWIGGYDESSSRAVRINFTDDDDMPYSIEIIDLAALLPGTRKMRGVVVGGDGREWLHTDAGVITADGKTRHGGNVTGICPVGEDTYFIDSDGGLFVAASGKSIQPLVPLDFGNVRDFNKIDDGRLAVATDRGLAVYNIRQRRWLLEPVSGGIGNLYVDSSKRVWLYTGNNVVALYDATGKVSYPPMAPADGQMTFFTEPMFHEDSFGTVWVAPKEGCLSFYDESSRRYVPHKILSPLLMYTALPEVEKSFPDENGNLWLISAHGLSLVKFNYQNYKNLPLDTNQETRSIAALSDGTLLAGSTKGVIAHYDSKGRLLGYLGKTLDADGVGRANLVQSPVRFSDRVYALYQAPGGTVWIGTKGDGMYSLDSKGNIRHYSRRYSGSGNLPCDSIYAFDTDTRGRLWVGTYGKGLYLAVPRPDGSFSFTSPASAGNKSYPAGDSFRYIRRITHNKKGEMIVSSNGGLITFSDAFSALPSARFKTTVPKSGDYTGLRNSNVMQALVARDGSVYVTTMGGEVQRLKGELPADGELHFESMSNPMYSSALSSGNVVSMIEDKSGRLYFVRETDIVCFDPKDRNLVILGPAILGGEHEFSEALPAIGKDGSLYFGAVGHVIKVDPTEVSKEPFTPNIIFTGLQLQGENQEQFILNPENIELQPDRRNFSLSFAALDYGGSGHIEYAYRFEPDTVWTYLGTSNVLQVTNLKPGVRRLFIRSTNGDGTWVDNEKYVDILVRPTFWETVWAKILIAILVIGVLLFIVHYYSVYRRNRLMAQMRKREHDFYVNASHKLRTPLSLIGSPVYEVLKSEHLSETGRAHLERVRRNAKNMLQVLNDMLSKEFKLEEIADDEPARNVSDDVRAGYMASENWLEVPEDKTLGQSKDTRILIVEDNEDLLGFLRDILSSQYEIITATNGKEGLEKAETDQPDFILTDVNMPEMDGLTMVKHIKAHKQMSHIPIIVLSAKATIQDRVAGLQAGIDDYISKPFSATYLRQRIANIIVQRRLLQQSYFEQLGQDMNTAVTKQDGSADVPPAPSEKPEYRLDSPQIIEADQVMMEKLMKFLEERIGDENLRIEEMAEAVSMGRTVFYGKIKAIVGMSPSDFLRSLRMQRAEELIVKSRMNFSQIAFSVGFSDPKYFTKCFKKETGMTPSEYRQKKNEETSGE